MWGQVKCFQSCTGVMARGPEKEAVPFEIKWGKEFEPPFTTGKRIFSQLNHFVEHHQVGQSIFAGKDSKNLLIGEDACFPLGTGKDIFY